MCNVTTILAIVELGGISVDSPIKLVTHKIKIIHYEDPVCANSPYPPNFFVPTFSQLQKINVIHRL
jgi:hypothetical protein